MKLRWERIAALSLLLVVASVLVTTISLVPEALSTPSADFSTISLCEDNSKGGERPKLGLGLTQDTQNAKTDSSENCYFPNNSQPTLHLDILKEDAQTAPFPEINANARLAKVPILMYHDILAEKEVFFDVTPQELTKHFQMIQAAGMTPVSLDLVIRHLRTGIPLPEKPVLLSFDDGYGGHYKYVYPLMKEYGYPAVFSIYVNKMLGKTARSSVTWEQLKEMIQDPLVTISCHSVSHPPDLTLLSDSQLEEEVLTSKKILEEKLGIPMRYFTYPAGKLDERVKALVIKGGYQAAIAMNDQKEEFAGQSPDLLEISRFGQSRIADVIPLAWGGVPLPKNNQAFNFQSIPRKEVYTIDNKTIILTIGGKPATIHAKTRNSVAKIIKETDAVAAVDGTFFSLTYLDSNEMIGPVLSQNEQSFIPGNDWAIEKIAGRPLVLISDKWVKFVPFDAAKHNTYEGISQESSDGSTITDAFVAGAWLVKNSLPQAAETFEATKLYAFEAERNRAFWGINQAGQPVIGITKENVDSVHLGEMLVSLGLRDVVMVDSGASADLVYLGKSQADYQPRPVPHVVVLLPPAQETTQGLLKYPCFNEENECL